MNKFKNDIPLHHITDGLRAQALSLAQHLFPNGVREGTEYRVGSLGGEKGRSLSVCVAGARAGVWSDFAAGEGGDGLDLIGAVLFGGNKAEAIKWAKGWLGLDGSDYAALRQTQRAVEAKKNEPPDDENKTGKIAMAIWIEAGASIKDTLAEKYLKGRGIDLRQMGRQPRALRYHPSVYHPETQKKHPALIALIGDGTGKPCAIHRTWLQENPDGSVSKLAGVKDAKLSLGRYRGGCIRLWKGTSTKPLSEAGADETIVITEGIEDGLSIAFACPEYRVLCAVALSNMRNVVLPDVVKSIHLAADNDADHSEAAENFKKAIGAHQAAGRTVFVARSPVGKDFNDALRGCEK